MAEISFKGTKPVSQLYLRTMSIYDYSQLSELKKDMAGEQQMILIARITPLMMKDPQARSRFMDDLYCPAIKKNYSLFRLGEERIIMIPHEVRVISR
jgi:SepF-like predicted cell division protein (DUF552 family)